jgi:hypothetical protein
MRRRKAATLQDVQSALMVIVAALGFWLCEKSVSDEAKNVLPLGGFH